MTDISPEAVERLREAVISASLQVEFRERVAETLRAQAQRIVELEAALKVAVSDNEKAAIAISDGLRGSAIKHMANSSVTLNAALEGKKP